MKKQNQTASEEKNSNLTRTLAHETRKNKPKKKYFFMLVAAICFAISANAQEIPIWSHECTIVSNVRPVIVGKTVYGLPIYVFENSNNFDVTVSYYFTLNGRKPATENRTFNFRVRPGLKRDNRDHHIVRGAVLPENWSVRDLCIVITDVSRY